MFPSLQLCVTGTFEIDGDPFLFFGDQSLSNDLAYNPNSTVLRERDISSDPRGLPSTSPRLRDHKSKCIFGCRFFYILNIQQLFLVTVHVNECINIMLCFKTAVSYTYVDFDNWRETLQTKYWLYLLNNLAVNKIVDELYQGVEGVPLIIHQVYDEIRNAKSNKEANTIFMRHLLTAGTVKQFWLFCKVLHQTSDDYGVHEEILEKLKEDFNFNF